MVRVEYFRYSMCTYKMVTDPFFNRISNQLNLFEIMHQHLDKYLVLMFPGDCFSEYYYYSNHVGFDVLNGGW